MRLIAALLAFSALAAYAAYRLLREPTLELEPTWHRMSLSPDTGNVNPPDPYLSSILWGRWA